jgi:rhodanese-related sulfurtransferase
MDTMPDPSRISPALLARSLGLPDAPLVLDLRIPEDHGLDPRLLPGAVLRDWHGVEGWGAAFSGRQVVTYCQRGLKLSHGVAAWLRHAGARAAVLEGGFEAWRDAGLPLVPDAALPQRDAAGRTVWVTRERPRVGRIACPWLIRRFVDRDAVFLFVDAAEVVAVAERFGAAAFDVEHGFWGPRGEFCTFDVMVAELGLAEDPALVHLSRIVRGATLGRPGLAPEAAGLLAASLGLAAMHDDDLAKLEAGMVLYDALYRWCRDAVAGGAP